MTWADIEPALDLIDSRTELERAISSPETFLENVLKAGGPAARKLLIAKLRHPLQPHVEKLSLTWEDVQPALELVDSLAELKEASSNPKAFFEKLLKGGGPAARRMLIAQLRPRLEPLLSQQGLQWSDVQPMLASVDTQAELQQALANPESFLMQLLAGAGGQVARKLLLPKLKPHLEPYLQERSLTWADVQPAFDANRLI